MVLDHCLIGTNVGYQATATNACVVNVNPRRSPLADHGGPSGLPDIGAYELFVPMGRFAAFR